MSYSTQSPIVSNVLFATGLRGRMLGVIMGLLSVFGVMVVLAPPAFGVEPRPGWAVFGDFSPTDLPPGGTDNLNVFVYNIGSVYGGTVTVTDTLPPGLLVSSGSSCMGAGTRVATCEIGSPAPGEAPNTFSIPVVVEATASNAGSPVDRIVASGGGALSAAQAEVPVTFGSGTPGFGFENFDAWFSNAQGEVDTQAGSHPYALTVVYAVNSKPGPYPYEHEEQVPSGGEVHTLNVNVPAGLVAEPSAVPQCTYAEFDSQVEGGCPADTQIGVDWFDLGGGSSGGVLPVFNMVPPAGVAAQFSFQYGGTPFFLDSGVRSGGDNGITTHVDPVDPHGIISNTTVIWGAPGEHGTGAPIKPFITLPTSCSEPPKFSIEAIGTWENPSAYAQDSSVLRDQDGEPTTMTGCERLVHFAPVLEASPETRYADTPTGLSAIVKNQTGVNPEGLATSGLRDTTVTLPEGVVINPGQATGLQACHAGIGPGEDSLPLPGQDGETEEFSGPPDCPSASKVGTDEIITPLLANPLKGNVYVLAQSNGGPGEPPNLQSSPPALQILVAASGEGVNLKLVGTIRLNETTGQLTTTFENTPDAPFSEFRLSFSGGAQAALATPTTCGTYRTTAQFTPWSAPFVEPSFEATRFAIEYGPNGTPCADPLPFAPSMTAGATTDQAGGYTDFTMLLTRGDGQQHMEKLRFNTPEGLLGMISKVKLCGEPQAAKGECPASSQIGHTVAEAGPGPYPFVIPEPGAPPAPIYLTGPYDGAPFGLSIAVPIVAGPFNLGTEVVRGKIEVDPLTARLTITTTPFPKTVKGIPTDIRAINAVIDRPEFMFNPTSCNPMSFAGTAYSFEGATAPLASHFQVGSCQALKFQPNFKVSTNGKTSRADGASLTAKIVYPVGNLGANQASSQSNIKAVKVDLPKQLPSRLTTLQKACPAKVFEADPADCPADSIVGHGKAITPLLPVPVEGPAYFVSHAGEEFPNLIVVLQGDNVTVELIGDTFINTKTNITSSTFKEVPDVPIQSFELNLPQGPYSALAANTNLCKVKGGLKMPTAFTGQNNAVIHETTPIAVTGCAKAVKKHKKAKAKKKHAKGKKKK